MNKKKIGILLILVAVLIGMFFLYEMFGKKNLKEQNSRTESVSHSATTTIIKTMMPDKPVSPTPKIVEMQDELKCEIRKEMLDLMGVTNQEIVEELNIYANSCGCADADSVQDMDEIYINYADKTITVPCYFALQKKSIKFDCIYNYEKKTYRFVPW